jgi:hypothetical protein
MQKGIYTLNFDFDVVFAYAPLELTQLIPADKSKNKTFCIFVLFYLGTLAPQ